MNIDKEIFEALNLNSFTDRTLKDDDVVMVSLGVLRKAWMRFAALYEHSPMLGDENMPVRYYRDGGVTYAVYGSSSINYVEKLRALLSKYAAPTEKPCKHCDGTGDVHSIDGEWRGACVCDTGKAVSAPAPKGAPDGYAYRYPDGAIRFTSGREINGSRPVQSIPYWFGTPFPQHEVVNDAPVKRVSEASLSRCPWCGAVGSDFENSPQPADYCDHG